MRKYIGQQYYLKSVQLLDQTRWLQHNDNFSAPVIVFYVVGQF